MEMPMTASSIELHLAAAGIRRRVAEVRGYRIPFEIKIGHAPCEEQ